MAHIMEIRIREAGLDDVQHLVHHRRAMFEDMKQGTAAELDRADQRAREYFESALRAGTYKGWLAEDQDELDDARNARVVAGGGMVIVPWAGYPGEKHAARVWIVNMYTEPHARRRGLAKKFVSIMTEWCRAEGFGSVSLHASDAGRLVYESLGFQPSNEMKLSLR
jgi:GNAT superfamily N-acetyltransferase